MVVRLAIRHQRARRSNAIAKPVFIVCQNRVGSTFLNRLLSAHPECWAFTEGVHQEAMDHTACPPWLSRTPFLDRWRVKTCGFIEAAWTKFWLGAVSAHHKAGVFKIPHALTKTHALQEIVPDVAFVLLVRNPVSQVGSALATGNSLDNLVVTAEALLEFLSKEMNQVRQLHVVKYEDLTSAPDERLAEICDFIGIDSSENVVRQCIDHVGVTSSPEYEDLSVPECVQDHVREIATLLDYELPVGEAKRSG